MKEKYTENRKKLEDVLEINSMSILFNGNAPRKRGDEQYLFAPDRNFLYFTGIEEEDCILVVGKTELGTETTLYIPPHNGVLAKWIGENITTEEAEKISGVTNVKYVKEFENDISVFIFKNNIENIYLDLERRNFNDAPSKATDFANEFKSKYPSITVKNAYPIYSQFRVIKEDWEVDLIRKAVDITEDGFINMMKNSKGDMLECELEAYFDFPIKSKGVLHKAFNSIVAGGVRACTLHYWKNDKIVNDGDLVLVDAGASYKWYSGDITRTFPINGKFSEKQKEVYQIVLDVQKLIIETIAPNVKYSSLNELVKDYYYKELTRIGLIKKDEPKDAVSRYYYHNIGHFLGLETHDVGKVINTDLQAGMVLTVEPGLYIEEWGIGIRIEDDVLVTSSGREVLTKKLPKTIKEIEDFMEKN